MVDLQRSRLLPKNRWWDHVPPSRPSQKRWLLFGPWHFWWVFERWMLSGGFLRDKHCQICFECLRNYGSHQGSRRSIPSTVGFISSRHSPAQGLLSCWLRFGVALALDLGQPLADGQAGLGWFTLNKRCFVRVAQQRGERRGERGSVKNASVWTKVGFYRNLKPCMVS